MHRGFERNALVRIGEPERLLGRFKVEILVVSVFIIPFEGAVADDAAVVNGLVPVTNDKVVVGDVGRDCPFAFAGVANQQRESAPAMPEPPRN